MGAIEVLAADGPVEHVAEKPQRPVDGRRGKPPAPQTIDHSRPLQVRNEVVDVGRPR
jgi:hypothetical protein